MGGFKASGSAPAEPDSALIAVLYLLFNLVSTVSIITINKYCFQALNFGFPAALSNIHYIVTWIGISILKASGIISIKPLPRNAGLQDPEFIAMALFVGVVTPLNNLSLKLNSIGFYQLVKLMVTPCVVVLEYVLDRKVISMNRAACLLAVSVCVCALTVTEMSLTLVGLAASAMWVPLAAAYKVQFGRLRKRYGGCDTLALMHALFPPALLVQTLMTPIVDPPGFFSWRWDYYSSMWLLLSGLAAFMVNWSGFLVMGHLGALAHVLLGQAKTCCTLLGAYIVFGATYSSQQLLAASGAMASIVAYAETSRREINEAFAQSQQQQQQQQQQAGGSEDTHGIAINLDASE